MARTGSYFEYSSGLRNTLHQPLEQGAFSDIGPSTAERRVPALILTGRPLEYFPGHCRCLDGAGVRDCDGHDHLPTVGHPHEGIPESGKHHFSLPYDLCTHAPDLGAQAVGIEFRLDGIDGRAQMLLTQRINAYLNPDVHGNSKLSILLHSRAAEILRSCRH